MTSYEDLSGAKIEYRTLSGFKSSAYVDHDQTSIDDGILLAEDKYTDNPIRLRKVDDEWQEIQ